MWVSRRVALGRNAFTRSAAGGMLRMEESKTLARSVLLHTVIPAKAGIQVVDPGFRVGDSDCVGGTTEATVGRTCSG
jgi:hypothetical protein